MKNTLWAILAILCVGSGCYDNIDTSPPEEVIVEVTPVLVTTQISGSVIDADDVVLSDYLLEINSEISDIASDYFLIEVEDARKKGQTIKVMKDGNPIGIRTELLVENDINHVQIKSHDVFKSEIKEQQTAEVQIRKYLTADFSKSRTRSGYVGDLSIEYININAETSLTSVAYDGLADLLAIASRGGFYLKASQPDGTDIKIDPEHPVTLQIGDLEDDSNGLFSFNQESELWVLVSEISSNMDVEILAEGYYTLGKYTPGVFVEGLITKEEKAVAYQPLNWNHDGIGVDFLATESGRWIAVLPEENDIIINVLNPCKNALQSEQITINTIDLQGQNIEITADEGYQFMNTTVIDCEGNISSTSSIDITSPAGASHYVFESEDQDRWIAVCDEFAVAAYNETEQQAGTLVQLSNSVMNENIFLSDCTETTSGFNFIRIKDVIKAYPAFSAEIINNRTIITSQDGEFKLIIAGDTAGQYNENQVNVAINDPGFGTKGYYISCETSMAGCGIDNMVVTQFSTANNGQISLTFSGELWMQTLNPRVAGTYDISGTILIQL